MNGYKVRTTATGSALTVPRDIARLIPGEMRFDCEVVEDGPLFRVRRAVPPPEGLPAWLGGDDSGALGSAHEPESRREP